MPSRTRVGIAPVVDHGAPRIAGVPFLVWFIGLVVLAHLARDAGILPDLDWIPRK